MQIWLIAENWAPRIGGIERYLEGVASNLAKNGHEVTVIVPALRSTPSNSPLVRGREPQTRTAIQIALLTKEGLGEVRVVRHRFFYPMIPKWFPLYLFLLKKAKQEKPDIIIAGKALFEGRLTLSLKKTLGIPYIVCTYGMEIATWQSNKKTKRQLEHVLRNAKHVFTINKKTEKELVELGIKQKNLSILYPGINPENLDKKNNPEEVLKKYNLTTPYILTVTRLVQRKGIDDLIRAVARLNSNSVIPAKAGIQASTTWIPGQARDDSLSLIIVGNGPERQKLEQIAQRLDAPVKLLGAISDEDVHALYSQAQLFALTPKELPGDYEGFGIVYLEAGFFGLPIVATRTGGVPEAVLDGETGILAEPGNSQSIAQAIVALLENPDKAKQYGEMGKQRVMNEFAWDKQIEILEHIILNKSVIPDLLRPAKLESKVGIRNPDKRDVDPESSSG